MISLVLTLAMKDWRLFWADRRAAVMCFVVPIILASVFGVLFDQPNKANVKLPMIVVAEDDGTFTQAVVADLLSSPRADAKLLNREQAMKAIADRRPGVAVVFPTGFEAAGQWNRDRKPGLEILHHPLCSMESQWAEGLVTEVVMKRLAKVTLTIKDDALSPPFETHKSIYAGAESQMFNSYSHSFSGMTLQYLLFWGMESGLLFLRERNRSVWRRQKTAPISFGTIIAGKIVATSTLALLQVLLTFGFGRIVFGVTIQGSWLGFAGLAIAISLLAAATGLAVAALGGTEGRARSLSILAILGLSMLGGLWIPSFVLPGWARDLSMILPTTWAMRCFDALTWQGSTLSVALPYIVAVTLFAFACFGLASYRLRKGVMV